MKNSKDTNDKALEQVLADIQKQFGKEAIMILGNDEHSEIETSSSGSLSLDIALGAGGYPKGRIIEIFGPESSGKTTLALHAIAEVQKSGGRAAFIDAEHALDPVYAQKLGVDIRTAMQRTQLAVASGMNIKDEKILADVILGKVKPKISKQALSNPFHANLTKADPKPMTSYFGSGYQRLHGDDSYNAFNAATNKDRFLGDLFGKEIDDSSQSWDAFSRYFKYQAKKTGSVITSRMRK